MRKKEIVIFSFLIAIFIAISFFSQKYAQELKELVEFRGFAGIVIYIIFAALSDVIVLATILPFVPLAVAVWGSFWAALMSIFGWTIGAMAVFWLTREYGRPLAQRITTLKKIEELGKAIPEEKIFWVIIFFRIIFPADILSYAIGLFTKIGWWPYLISTAIGMAPFAFLLAYGVTLPFWYQLIAAAVLLMATVLFYSKAKRRALDWLSAKKEKIN